MSRLDYHRDRKKLTKHHFIRGTMQVAEGENEIKIENSAGVPFRKIEITGNTNVEIKNQALDYTTYLSTLENYTTAGISGTYAIKLPDGWENSVLTYTLEEKTPLSGACLYLATGSTFSTSSTLPLIENGTLTSQTTSNYTHLIFKGINEEEIEDENGNISSVPSDIAAFWQNHTLIVTSVICPERPATIKSTGSKEGAILVRSPNLIKFKDSKGSRTDSDGNILSWEVKDGIVTVNGKQNKLAFVTLDSKNLEQEIYEAGTYSYTTSYYQEAPFMGGCDWAFRYADDLTSRITGYTDGRTSRKVEAKTIDKPFRVGYVQLYIYSDREYNDYKFTIALFKGDVTATEMIPYEPYFKNELNIPSSVALDGKDVALPLTVYDRLIVDGARKKVIYEKKSGTYNFKGTEAFSVATTNNNDLFAYKIEATRLGFKKMTGNGYCTHFMPKSSTELANRGELSFDYSSFGEQCVCFLYDDFGYSFDNMFTAKNEFKSWLKGEYDLSRPVTIVAEYKEAESIDITNTDFGKALLDFCMEKGKNGYLCLKSDPSTTTLVCEYYSLENEDKASLQISYKDENGTKILEDKCYYVRKGSCYQITAPHIDGYTRTMGETFGIASGDTTIDLIYMEE